jgi:DNA-binding protein HU-beta
LSRKVLDLHAENIFYCKELPRARQEVAVNRRELVESVAGATGLDKRRAESAVLAFINAVKSETTGGSRVSIFGFGTFTPTSRAARTGRNPRTGDPVKIAASKGVKFTPSSAFKTALNSRAGAKRAGSRASTRKSAATRAAGKKTAKVAKRATKSARR